MGGMNYALELPFPAGASLSQAGILALCRFFGLPVPPAAAPGDSGCWLEPPEPGETRLEKLAAAIRLGPIASGHQGLALTPQTYGCVRLEESFSEDLVYEISATGGRRYALPRHAQEQPDTGLAALIAELRQLLGARDWLIFYGCRDAACFLLDCRPWGWEWPEGPWLSLPDAPLPPLTRPLSLGLIQAAAQEWREQIDPAALEQESLAYDWFETLAGRLVLSGPTLAARLGYLPGQAESLRLGDLGQLASWRRRLRKLSKEIWDTFVVSSERFSGNLQQAQEIYRRFLPAYGELGAHIRALAAPLEAHTTFAGYLSDHLNPSSRLHDSLIPLWESTRVWLEDQPADADLLDLLADPGFRRSWQLLMGQFGHFAPYGLDLTWPRLQDQPRQLLTTLAQRWSSDDFVMGWNRRSLLDRPRWMQVSRLIDLRESFLADVLWALHQLRQRLMTRAEALVSEGRLPEAEAIWWLSPDELSALDQPDHSLAPELIAARRQRYARWQTAWNRCGTTAELSGYGLLDGVFQGKVWRLDQPESQLPEAYQPHATILVTETVDAGWIPCLELVTGVILTRGEPLSAAAILLRELGKPAVLGAAGAAGLEPGQWLRLNAETGGISRIDVQA